MMNRTPVYSLALVGLLIAAQVTHGDIQWKTSGATPLKRQAAPEITTSLNNLAAGQKHIIVQFDTPIQPAERVELREAGLELLGYLGDYTFFAAIDNNKLDPATITGRTSVSAVSEIALNWKLHPDFAFDNPPSWSIVSRNKTDDTSAVTDNTVVAAYILFHKDQPLADAVNLSRRHGAWVRSVLESIHGLVIELPYGAIRPLASEDAVSWIEPPLPKFSELNDDNRLRTETDIVQAAPYSLDGSGVSVMVYDGGYALDSHGDFGGRLTVRDTAGLSDHATHVAGTVGGDGAGSGGTFRGMAPGVIIESYGFEQAGGLSQGFLYTDPGDLEADYTEAINTFGCDISNNSIGTNTAPNGFPCDWEGNYGATGELIDAIVGGSLGAPFRVVWANGNERQGSANCGSTYLTTAPPACAKNHITVGALNSDDDSVTSFTSWGPCDDGRIKPDISGPGCQVTGDGSVTSCSSGGGYTTKCGTSMASPTVCGVSALLLQDFRIQYPTEPDFRNSTLKAFLAHTAADIANPGPDYQSGYGSVRAQAAIDFMRTGNFLEDSVDQGQVFSVLVVVNPGDPELRVTLTWDDVPGTPNVNPVLVNDLDLEVFDSLNTQYYPWTLDPANPSVNAVQNQPDHVNNIEQVVINTPGPGVYRVDVRGFNVPQGPQTFSLTASPLLVACSSDGFVSLDRVSYACSSSATLRVVDCDLNTDNGLVETVSVTISSDSEPGGETILLTETAAETATFESTVPLSTVDAAGTLLVSSGDTVSLTYIDADDGVGGTNIVNMAIATVDCDPPVISNVLVSNIGPRDATITFDTDELANGTVRYGTDCALLTDSTGEGGFHTSHTINLSGLSDNTIYYFAVDADDQASNSGSDDNGGLCYTFTTPEVPDFHTESFAGDNDLDNTSILLVPNASIDFYAVCAEPTVTLPTPPGGTTLVLTDDDSELVTLTGGAMVSLFGVNYGSFYVGSNGYLTFTGGDSTYTETLAAHYDQPRVSAVFDDLNPSVGGTVQWEQLADRAVVTWTNVPEYSTSNSNTFQVELYFNGDIRISYLRVDATDGISGVSEGLGVSPDFFEFDLSAAGSCGPRPPTSASQTLATPTDTPLVIALQAADDGQPGPLTYTITSLPAQTLTDDGNAHVITLGDLPYTLVGGGNSVTYSPGGGFLGPDSFQFKTDDGGTPPDGGESNTATITINIEQVLNLPFFDDFPTTTFDVNKWESVTDATIDGNGIAEPSEPNSARFNGNPSGIDEIISQKINLLNETAVIVSYHYQQTGGGESPDAADDLFIEYLDDTFQWQLLNQHLGADPDMTTYQYEEVLLPAPAYHALFQLRVRASGTAGAFDDWFVDDIGIAVDAPTPPLAISTGVVTPTDTPISITLQANDDGEPNPPAALTYTITSLPAQPLSDDGNAHVILPGDLPYTLVGGGNSVTYSPSGGFAGPDTFDFIANDGGTPPLGGDSNTATITVNIDAVLELPFFDDFPTTTFDPNKWESVSGAEIDTVGISEPSEPNSARFNGDPSGDDEIVSKRINLAGQTMVTLSYHFEQTGGGESPDAGDDLFIEYLDNTLQWQLLNQHLGADPDMTSYQLVETVLPAAAYHGIFQLRVRCSVTSGLFDDWFVDNIGLAVADAPTADGQQVATPVNVPIDITLTANDPNGDPLDFIITSLPSNGTLTDPNGGAIGAVPYTLLTQGDVVNYAPTPPGFQGPDSFNFKVNDGTNDSNIATVDVSVGGPVPIFEFLVDDTDPGWTTEGQWAFGQPTGGGSNGGDPTGGFTGVNVYGYNLNGDYTDNMPVEHLTTTAIDCSNVIGAELRFQRWLGIESSTFDHASIEVSNNGSTWNLVWDHIGGSFSESAWTAQAYDISAVADGQPTVFIRWAMGTTDGSVTYPGWNIDDVRIWGNLATIDCQSLVFTPGDTNLDLTVDGIDVQTFVDILVDPAGSWTPEQLCAADMNDDDSQDTGDVSLFVTELLNQ